MTQPALAFNLRGRGRHYPFPPQPIDDLPLNQWKSVNPEDIPDGLTPLPSVTNILGILDKPALLGWYGGEALIAALNCDCIKRGGMAVHHRPCDCTHARTGKPVKNCKATPTHCSDDCGDDLDHIVRAHQYAANQTRDVRAEAGTRAHTLAERLTTDAPLPAHISEEDEAYADAFMAFVTDHDPEWLEVEVTVAHPEAGYAGTADWIAVIDGVVTLGDYKTRGQPLDPKKLQRTGLLYDENRAQLAALASATYMYGLADGKWQTVDIYTEQRPQAGMGVVLCPDGTYHTETLDRAELDRCLNGFLGALQAWRWLNGVSNAA